MSRKGYTFIVMASGRREVRQFKMAGIWLKIGLLLLVVSLAFGGLGIYRELAAREDRRKMAALLHENQKQDKELKTIAGEMESLRQQLVRLHQLDQKIRIIANLEQSPSEMHLSGIGGVSPEEGILKSLSRERKDRWVGTIRRHLGQLKDLAGRQEKSFHSLGEQLSEKRDLLASTPSIWPTEGWLTSGFGYRQSPFTGLREFHRGLDVATRKGTPVIAPADGVVLKSGKDRGFGFFIRLKHGFGYQTYYGHLNKVMVKKGQRIHRGQMIAEVGNTGRSTGPHLHYEVHVNGLPVNPLRYILN